ncbi:MULTISPECIES: thiamine diphosphokinase [Enterococcus]|uniref:Thiamine diphosphokinase n=1 Tax=Enterococcus lemanii TaxID=1159752 RepID=A0ABV9MUW8_9ENTE|nr:MULTISPECIES: thiamine diphosphokinase [Enterococcus]MBD9903001.1 thiamine diphosphokinase [Enterococcus faecium]MBM7710166.1 thiamine pyrophosphokinase [Enterococcus lemanii]
MKILLVSGGQKEYWPKLNKSYDYYVGIDRGSLYLLEAGLPLDLAVGDFDSLTPEEKINVFNYAKETLTAPSEKDDTDTQLAVSVVLKHYPEAEIELIGATGGRIDHFLANLWLVLEDRFRVHSSQITLRDKQNTIQFFLPGTHRILAISEMKYLAYCCLTAVSNLTLENSKYTLANHTVAYPMAFASNEFLTSEAKLSFSTGMVAVIQSKD